MLVGSAGVCGTPDLARPPHFPDQNIRTLCWIHLEEPLSPPPQVTCFTLSRSDSSLELGAGGWASEVATEEEDFILGGEGQG